MKPVVTLILVPGKTLIELDALISATHQDDVEVTDHPVEKGANITDHARRKPPTVTLEGLVSNTPVNRTQQTRTLNLLGGVTIVSNTDADSPAGVQGISEETYQKLQALAEDRPLVTVATPRRTHKNMILTSLTAPEDSRTGDALRFTATFKNVRFAEVRRKEIVTKKEPKARGKVATGKQVAKPATPEQERSLLHQGSGGADNLLKNVKGLFN